MNHSVYDYIVLGASIPGIVFAIKKSLLGHRVLLTAMYGFPGGSITENLNCRQEIDESGLQGIAEDIYQAMSPDLFERSIVNPESLKYILQHTLENSSVDLYFHVLPKKIDVVSTGVVELSFLAKEGITARRGKKVVDASDTLYGAMLLGRNRTLRETTVDFFITRPADENFLSFEKIRHAVKLSDGRYWISLHLATHDDLFAENDTHALLDTFRGTLENSNSRIHVLPLGAHAIFELESSTARTDAFATIDDILGCSCEPSHQFLRGSLMDAAHVHF